MYIDHGNEGDILSFMTSIFIPPLLVHNLWKYSTNVSWPPILFHHFCSTTFKSILQKNSWPPISFHNLQKYSTKKVHDYWPPFLFHNFWSFTPTFKNTPQKRFMTSYLIPQLLDSYHNLQKYSMTSILIPLLWLPFHNKNWFSQ